MQACDIYEQAVQLNWNSPQVFCDFFCRGFFCRSIVHCVISIVFCVSLYLSGGVRKNQT
jgi:hypothetical protein